MSLYPLDSAAREAIRAALVAASGNVRAASRTLYPERSPRGAYDKLHREIGRLDLRAWLTEAYDRTDRQPVQKQNRTPARRKAKPDK